MRKSLLLSIILVIKSLSYGQHWYGLSQSNYQGVNAFYTNTAQSVSSPFKLSFNGFATGLHFQNDYLTYKLPFTFTEWATGNVPTQYKNNNGNVAFQTDWFQENLDGSKKNMNLFSETRGPGVSFNYDRKFSFGIFTKTVVGLQVHNVDEKLARVFRHGLDSSGGNIIYNPPSQIQFGEEYGDNSMHANLNAYNEIGIGMGAVLFKNTYTTFSVGANVKYLMGMGTAYLKNNGTTFKVNGYDSINIGKTDAEYGYATPGYFQNLNSLNFLNGTPSGSGLGFDFSAYLEMKKPAGRVGRTVGEKDVEYFFRGGISILDIGGITYNENVNARKISNETNKTYVPGIAFAEAWNAGFESGLKYTDSISSELFTVEEINEIRTTLPTAIALQGDLKIISGLFIGIQAIQSFKSKESIGLRRPSSVVAIPRFEKKGFEIAIPLSLHNDYQNGSIGFFVRLGPFFFGSDNVIGSINRSSFNSFNYYAGLSYGVGNSRKNFK